jgi:hypothetical protein
MLVGAAALLAATGAGAWLALAAEPEGKPAQPKRPGEPRRSEISKNVFLETQGDRRRVVVAATVVLRENSFPLEGLLTRTKTKEYEYILATDADARSIHAGLLAAGARAGSPARSQPKNQPASGSVVKITLRYQQDGKAVTVPAQQWVRNVKTHKDLDRDWVFAGSYFVRNPDDPCEVIYAAIDGDYVCVCDMMAAMLALPVQIPTDPELRQYEPHPERVPPLGTRVEVILEPVRSP